MAYEPTLDDVLNSLYGPEGGLTEEELAQYMPEPYEAPQSAGVPQAGQAAPTARGRGPDSLYVMRDRLIERGLPPHVAAGLVGGFMQESGGRTGIKNSIGAYGAGQWLGARLHGGKGYVGLLPYAQSRGMSPDDPTLQADYTFEELQGPERKALQRMLATSTPEEAALAARKYYERPGEHEANDANRVRWANTFYGAAGAAAPAQAQAQAQPQESPFDVVTLSDGSTVEVEKGADLASVAAILKKNGIEAEPLRQVGLPDGSYVEAPYSYTDDQVFGIVKKNKPELFGQQAPEESDKKGYGAAAKSSFESGIGSALTGLGGLGTYAGEKLESPLARQAGEYLTGKGKEWQKMGEEAYQELTPEEAKAMGVSGQFRRYIGEPLAGFAGSAAAALPALALPGGAATRIGAFTAQELGSQLERQEAEGKPVDVEKAAPWALASGVVQNSLLGPLKYVNQAFGKPAIQAELKRITETEGAEAAKDYAKGLVTNVLKEVGGNTLEVIGSEGLSSLASRGAAGLDLASPEALEEYKQTAIQSAPGGLLGIPGGFGRHAAQQGIIEETQLAKQQQDQAARIAAERQAAGEAAGAEEVAQSEADAELERQAGIGVPEPTIRGEENVAPEELAPIPEEQPAIVEPPAVVPPAAPETTPEAVQEPAPVEPPAPAHFSENLGIASKSGKKTDIPLKRALAQLDIDNPQDQPVIVQALETALPLAEQGKIQLDIPKAQAIINQFKPVEAPSAQPIPQASPTLRSRSPQPQVREEGGDQAIIGKGVEPSGQRIETPEIKIPEAQAPEVTGLQIEDLPDNRFRVRGIDADTARTALKAAKLPTGSPTPEGLIFNNKIRDRVVQALEMPKLPEVAEVVPKLTAEQKVPSVPEEVKVEAPQVEKPAPIPKAEAPKQKPTDALASKITAVQGTLREVSDLLRAEQAKPKPNPALVSQYKARQRTAETTLQNFRRQQTAVLDAKTAERTAVNEALAARAREEAARKVQEQGGFEKDLIAAEKAAKKVEKERVAPLEPVKPIKEKLREVPTEEDLFKRIEEMQGKKKEVKAEAVQPAKDEDITVAQYGAEPTPKEELVDRAIRRILHREETGEDIWVPGAGRKQVQATLRKALTERSQGKITEEQFASRISNLLDQETIKAAERKYKSKERVRGADYIRQRLLEAKRRGDISEKASDMGEWFAKQNPELFDDLGIAIKATAPQGLEHAAGFYNKLNRVATLITESSRDTTAVHEMLHHLERMMPAENRLGISKAWLKDVAKARAKAEKAGDAGLVDMLDKAVAGDMKGTNDALLKLTPKQATDNYALTSPSEFWAVHGTDILENRYNSSPALLKRLRNWLREFKEHIKSKFGLRSDAPILKAIDHMLKETKPEYKSERLMGEDVGKQEATFVAELKKPLVKETEAESSLKRGAKEAINAFKGNTWTRMETNYVNRHAALADAIKDKSTIDANGKYRADLIGSANDQIFNVISAGITDGVPVFSNAGTVMVQKDAKKNLSSIAKRIDKLSVKNPRAFVGEIARALRGEELKKEDAEALKTIDTLEEKAKKLKAYAKTQSFAEGKKADVLANRYLAEAKKLKDRVGEEGREKLVSNEDIVEAKRRLAKHPEIQGILDDVHGLMNSLVDLWEASGLVSKDVAKDWRSKPSYIPLYMSQEDILNDPSKVVRMLGGGAKSLPNVKALKGGTHAINLLENLQKHYAFMTSAAAQNAYRKAAARDLELFGAAERTSPDNKNAIMFKEDGKEVYYEIFDPLMFEAFQAAAPLTNPLLKAARGYTKAFRAVTLVNPLYWYRQLVRDPIHANVVSQTGMVTPIGATISFAKIIAGASPEYAELRRRGVVGAVDSLTDPARFKKIYDKGPHLFKKGADWVMHVHEAADAATRVEVYKAAMKEAKKRGMGDEKAKDYATMRAREIINFANQGRSETLQAIRATVPFFSAALNSLDSVARAATGKGLNRREAAEARRLFTSRMLMIASFTTAYTLAMQDDEDYLKSPDAVNNWLMPTGNKNEPFKMLSLPFELGFAAKVIPELIVRLNSGTLRPYEGEKMAKEAAAATLTPPLPLPQVLKPLIELAINLDLHTGRPIVSPSEARKLPEEQTRGASALSIELGRKFGLSPIQIEHFGSGYLTELWAVTSMLAEKFLPAGQMREERYPGEVPILAGGSKGISSKPDRDRDVNMFYELSQATQRIHDSVVSAQGKGDVDAMERLMADPENEKRFYASKIGRNIGQTMMEVNKSIEQIRNDKSITDPKEKQIRIRELRQYYNQLASQGVEWFYSEGIERP